MKNIEFATVEERVIVIRDSGQKFLSEEKELIDEMYNRIEKEFPTAFKALKEYYKKSRLNGRYFKYLVVRKFIKCNFGTLDYTTMDIDRYENLNFERVACPCRGDCPMENIVCTPKFATGLSRREEEVVKLACSGATAESIADSLNLSVWTVRAYMKQILGKLGFHSFKQVINWWHEAGYSNNR